MTIRKFELFKDNIEISVKDMKKIKQGCTFNQSDHAPELIKSFDKKEDAIEKLESYDTYIKKLSNATGTYYLIEEYYLVENHSVLEVSKMEIKVEDEETGEALGVFDNMAEAMQKENELYDESQEKETYKEFRITY